MEDTLKKLRKIEFDTSQIYEQGTLYFLRLIYGRCGVAVYRKALEHLERLEQLKKEAQTNRELFEKGCHTITQQVERNAFIRFGENYIEQALKELDKLEKFYKGGK